MSYIPDAQAAAFRESIHLGVYWRLALDPADGGPLRFWMGVNDAPQKMRNVEMANEIYRGAGQLLDLPPFEILINGVFDRLEFRLSGVSVEASNMIALANPKVMGREVHIGIGALDESWQPATNDWIALTHGTADYWAMTEEVSRGPAPKTRVLSLSVGFGETARSRPRRVTYTQAQQQLLYPTDNYCQNVTRYDRGFSLSWPRF